MIERCSDESDRATALEEAERAAMVEKVRAAAARALRPVGSCYFCDESVAPGRVFCNADCAEDYELLRAARWRNGG